MKSWSAFDSFRAIGGSFGLTGAVIDARSKKVAWSRGRDGEVLYSTSISICICAAFALDSMFLSRLCIAEISNDEAGRSSHFLFEFQT